MVFKHIGRLSRVTFMRRHGVKCPRAVTVAEEATIHPPNIQPSIHPSWESTYETHHGADVEQFQGCSHESFTHNPVDGCFQGLFVNTSGTSL